ncbi:hypothetical protein FLL45_22645 [Aliikangiella marina]|uniref:Uncharacterized protein n=1 Tax=Aliikangiella marina TaxID=1712262 RepID=A0A545T1L3_9GAMM|nr:hypothetical protein [Aliikangiella marina]TQV71127.1 hypothetical protein FLL45_22645 [Aliikangiella marina]
MKIIFVLLLFPFSVLAECPSWPKAIADMQVSACKVVDVTKWDGVKESRLLLAVSIKDLYLFSANEPLNTNYKNNLFKKGQEFRVLMDQAPNENCGLMKHRQSSVKFYKAILTKSCCDTGGGYSCLYDEVFGTPIPGTWFDDDEPTELNEKDDWDFKGHNKNIAVDATNTQES